MIFYPADVTRLQDDKKTLELRLVECQSQRQSTTERSPFCASSGLGDAQLGATDIISNSITPFKPLISKHYQGLLERRNYENSCLRMERDQLCSKLTQLEQTRHLQCPIQESSALAVDAKICESFLQPEFKVIPETALITQLNVDANASHLEDLSFGASSQDVAQMLRQLSRSVTSNPPLKVPKSPKKLGRRVTTTKIHPSALRPHRSDASFSVPLVSHTFILICLYSIVAICTGMLWATFQLTSPTSQNAFDRFYWMDDGDGWRPT